MFVYINSFLVVIRKGVPFSFGGGGVGVLLFFGSFCEVVVKGRLKEG